MSYKCKQCSKFYATRQSRWKHQQRCRGAHLEQEAKGMIRDYRKSDYQTIDDNESADGIRNPKVYKFVKEIVNEDDDGIVNTRRGRIVVLRACEKFIGY